MPTNDGIEEKKTYRRHTGNCENCKVPIYVDIPKGTTVGDFLERYPGGDICPYCGCKHGLKY